MNAKLQEEDLGPFTVSFTESYCNKVVSQQKPCQNERAKDKGTRPRTDFLFFF